MTKNENKCEKQENLQEIKDSLQRLQAEFENFRKRTEKEKQNFASFANIELIKKILPIVDNFELALENKEQKDFIKGIEMIYAQLKEVLDEEGLEKIPTKEFDPKFHEAILVEEGDKNEIKEVLQEGYKIKDNIIRHTKVKITKEVMKNE